MKRIILLAFIFLCSCSTTITSSNAVSSIDEDTYSITPYETIENEERIMDGVTLLYSQLGTTQTIDIKENANQIIQYQGFDSLESVHVETKKIPNKNKNITITFQFTEADIKVYCSDQNGTLLSNPRIKYAGSDQDGDFIELINTKQFKEKIQEYTSLLLDELYNLQSHNT